jgi:hypothetical protein
MHKLSFYGPQGLGQNPTSWTVCPSQDPIQANLDLVDGDFSAELHRLRGVFLAAMGADEAQIEASFCEAIRIAKEQKAVSLEKRAEATTQDTTGKKRVRQDDADSDYLSSNFCPLRFVEQASRGHTKIWKACIKKKNRSEQRSWLR